MDQNELEIARLKEEHDHAQTLRRLELSERDQKIGWAVIPIIIIIIVIAVFVGTRP